MRRGQHMGPREGRTERRGGGPAHRRMLVLALALGVVGVGGTLAWYSESSGITNLFNRATANPEISEKFQQGGDEKRDVMVEVPANDTNVTSYVRAQVDVHWVDADGNRLWEQPVEKAAAPADDAAAYDYELKWNVVSGAVKPNSWHRGADGIYYWTSSVQPGAKTGVLITSCVQQKRHSDGRKLVVEVSAQAIQADPATAFNESWGTRAQLMVGADGNITERVIAHDQA